MTTPATPRAPGRVVGHDFETLYRLYGAAVTRRAKRLLPPSEVEDLVHDVFLKLLENPASFRGESSPATWLYRVATRLCLDRLRNRSRQAALISRHGPTMLPAQDHAGDPEARIFLESLWRTLDEELALVGVLYYVDGLTTADIGRMLGVTDRTIANRLQALATAARNASEIPVDGGTR